MTTSSPIRVAIVGYGAGGRSFHAPYLSACREFEVSIVVTSNPERRRQVRADLPTARVVESLTSLLGSSAEIDVAVVATPNDTHASVTRSLLEAGLDVVIDKPITLTAVEAIALEALAQDRRRVLVPYFNRRWDSDFVAARAAVISGEIGLIANARSAFSQLRPHAKLHWSTRNTHDKGGGMFHSRGVHLIDQAVVLFGPIVVVRTTARCERVADVPDEITIELDHRDGTHTTLFASDLCAASEARWDLRGTGGTLRIVGYDPQERAIRGGVVPSNHAAWREAIEQWAPIAVLDGQSHHQVEATSAIEFWQRLALYLSGNGDAPVDLADAVYNSMVMDAAYRSWRESRQVTVEDMAALSVPLN